MTEVLQGCVAYSVDVYLRRARQEPPDTNPRIVRMLAEDGTPQDHWYYRSDQVVATSEFLWPQTMDDKPTVTLLKAHEGTLEEMADEQRQHFAEDRCVPAEDLIALAERALHGGYRSYSAYLNAFSPLCAGGSPSAI